MSSPPKWMAESTRNVSFQHTTTPNYFPKILSTEKIEAMNLLVESKIIPLIIQLNDMKRGLDLMRVTLNSLVEEINEKQNHDE